MGKFAKNLNLGKHVLPPPSTHMFRIRSLNALCDPEGGQFFFFITHDQG